MKPNIAPHHARRKGALEAAYVARASLPAISDLTHALDKVRACLAYLVERGYAPTHVEADRGGIMPVIWIELHRGCARLQREGAAWYRSDGFPGGRSLTWQARILGCRVQWIEIVMGGRLPC